MKRSNNVISIDQIVILFEKYIFLVDINCINFSFDLSRN